MAQRTLDRPSARTARARGPLFWAGVGLMMAGLGLLGYVAWQLFGTNIVSHQKQRGLIAETHRVWSQAGTSGHARGVGLKGAEALVRIPRFGPKYLVPVQAGVTADVLAQGLGHFKGSADPGQVGNFAIAGHRVTHGEPLRHMPSLRPGDKIVVETKNHTYTYRLDTNPNDLIVTFNDIWVVDRLPRNPAGGVEPAQRPGQRLVTLTTCSELFHTDNRMVAFGHLVRTTPR